VKKRIEKVSKMDLNEVKGLQNIFEMAMEDQETVVDYAKKFHNAFNLSMKNEDVKANFDKTIKEHTGFYVLVDILQALDSKITSIDNNLNALGAMFAQFLNRNDPELAKLIMEAVDAQNSVSA
jgi:hypothetical protein